MIFSFSKPDPTTLAGRWGETAPEQKPWVATCLESRSGKILQVLLEENRPYTCPRIDHTHVAVCGQASGQGCSWRGVQSTGQLLSMSGTVANNCAATAENSAASNPTFEETNFRLGTKLSGFWMSLPVAASVGNSWKAHASSIRDDVKWRQPAVA